MLKFMFYLIFSVPEVSLPSFSACLEQMVKLQDAISLLVPVASVPLPPSHSYNKGRHNNEKLQAEQIVENL